MARVLGIGGEFFKSNNPGALAGWYRAVLGLDIEDDLDGILARCAEHGVQPTVLSDELNGRFAHMSTRTAR